mmetsp:Transcript_19496/g.19524  ORF Transcript_19496/g.19524 Transcript_19496/m.19524 type:complete len:105 (-) Transcript_19496:2701-3015(-)
MEKLVVKAIPESGETDGCESKHAAPKLELIDTLVLKLTPADVTVKVNTYAIPSVREPAESERAERLFGSILIFDPDDWDQTVEAPESAETTAEYWFFACPLTFK